MLHLLLAGFSLLALVFWGVYVCVSFLPLRIGRRAYRVALVMTMLYLLGRIVYFVVAPGAAGRHDFLFMNHLDGFFAAAFLTRTILLAIHRKWPIPRWPGIAAQIVLFVALCFLCRPAMRQIQRAPAVQKTPAPAASTTSAS